MSEINTCERASDLIAFVYNEAGESATRDFELHLKECGACRQEVASFGLVRSSITAWRDEALSGFVSTPLTHRAPQKSALAALRQFFDLSPLWLKGATGFAVVMFCVLAALAVVKLQSNRVQVQSKVNSEAVYTEEDLNLLVSEALARQESVNRPIENPLTEINVRPLPPRRPRTTETARSRRPLSRAEREQLASDLRLLSNQDDAGLSLLGDRINR